MWICPKERFSGPSVFLHWHSKANWGIYVSLIYVIIGLDYSVYYMRRQAII